MAIDIRIDLEGMEDIQKRLSPDRIPQAMAAVVSGITRLLLRYSQINAPVRTGNLRRAGFMQIDDGGQSAIVAFGSHYAGVIEGGSQAHEIWAKNARTLAFVPTNFTNLADALSASDASRATGTPKAGAGDLVIFPSHVFHPGTVANPFMQSGWEDSKPEVSQHIQKVGLIWASGEDQTE